MRTRFLKYSVLSLAATLSAIAAKAQTVIYHDSVTHSKQGVRVERIQGGQNSKAYKMVLANDRVTELYVGGVKIPATDWSKYSDAIAAIRDRVKKNRQEAARNAEQARLNETQNKKNEEEAAKNAEEAKLNEAQNKKNAQQARVNETENKKNNKQVRENEVEAKKNQQENERLMQQIATDLVTDKVIHQGKDLRDFTLNNDGMTVNGIKQPDDVFKKYKRKYSKLPSGGFSYHR